MKKWFVKQRAGTGYLNAWTRFTCVKYKDGSPDWKYHTQMLHFSQSRVDAKRFDKEKAVLKFIRNSNDLKKMYDAGQIIIQEEDV